jgi:glutathione S-transferase
MYTYIHIVIFLALTHFPLTGFLRFDRSSGVLVRQDQEEKKEHFRQLVAGLVSFSAELTKSSGPLFLADSQLSNVDLALIPWAFRYYVLEHWVGPEFKIPTENLAAYHEWFDHVMNLESVKRTLPDKERYLQHIFKYADGSARSKVANAVRRGVAAHELDDEKDEY